MSVAALAARIHYSKGYLSRVENGRVVVNKRFAEICDQALGAGGALVVLAAASGRRDSVVPVQFSGLPTVTRWFFGRDEELDLIRRALSAGEPSAGVCVLSGMAGVGKTMLALRAAWSVEDQFPDGCVFFDCRSCSPPSARLSTAEILDAVLRTLGVPGELIPGDLDGRANLYRHRLRGKRVLFVYDNIGSAAQAMPLLPAGSGCRVLITSRNRLTALDDAVHIAVGVLPTDAGIRLFQSIAGEQVPAADEPVRRVVEQCGNLPLAIRIAAALVRDAPAGTFEEVGEGLADEATRLDALDDGERSVLAAFDLSYRGLPSELRLLLGLLALYPGYEIEAGAAAALAGQPLRRAERLLRGLSDACLLFRTGGGYHKFHDLVRIFAAEHVLTDISDADQAAGLTRLLDYSLVRMEASAVFIAPHRHRRKVAYDHLPGFSDRNSALEWIEREWLNVVALCTLAEASGMHERCYRLALLLRDYFFLAKLWDPWIETHRIAAAAARAVHDLGALGTVLNNLGIAHAERGDLSLASAYYQDAISFLRRAEDVYGATNAACNLAWVDLYLGNHTGALQSLRSAREFYRRIGAVRNAAITLRGIALAETELELFEDALLHAEQAFTEADGLGLQLDAVMSVNGIAWAHYRSGRHPRAALFYEKAVAMGKAGDSRYEVARAMTGLGNIYAAAGRFELAEAVWAQASDFHAGLDPRIIGEARVRQGLIDSPRRTDG